MEKLDRIKGRHYTQINELLPIEERVFFTQGKVANVNDFRFATEEEISAWREYEERLRNMEPIE